ncbi:NAD-dependent epimerase/dehydratase family protein [Palleronia caenipelagi]|uniref:NAD(P)-dependent oxidoreductase n=1 Tax=Palleronia caenipelagi TaxID=2489174 RepID=A0A547PNR7_9RHOB|nr:NAD(P)-dependent oxidoreductase [Palleronia caenipelagi]TRD15792.1 NAD(P)-dependent oxidoreductase [Palleronia caenipelagi]
MSGRILVTGATGFLGGAVLRRLGVRGIGQGRDVQRLAMLSDQGLQTVRWSLPDPAPEAEMPEDISAIVHAAGLSAPFGPAASFHRVNVLGTEAVLDFARARRIRRVVFVSSPSVYFALRDQLNVSEDMVLPRPFNAYAASKRAAERRVIGTREVGPVILRPRGLYGPGDTALLPRLLCAASDRALPRFRDGRARIDLTYIDDVVAAVLAALDAGPVVTGRVYNISGGEVLSIRNIVEDACARSGIPPRWRDLPLAPALLAARAAEAVALMRPGQPEPAITRYALGLFAYAQSLNISRAREELGWSPRVSFAEGLDRTFAAKGAT